MSSLRTLEKAKSFHGRLKLNNIHVDINEDNINLKLNDYGIYNDVYRGHRKIVKNDLASQNDNSDASNQVAIT